jgi:hypothetical protein
MLIYVKTIKKFKNFFFYLCLFYDNFMLINVKKKKKCFSSDGQTDRRTDTRSTQNYSSEPHNITLCAEPSFFILLYFLCKNLLFLCA